MKYLLGIIFCSLLLCFGCKKEEQNQEQEQNQEILELTDERIEQDAEKLEKEEESEESEEESEEEYDAEELLDLLEEKEGIINKLRSSLSNLLHDLQE